MTSKNASVYIEDILQSIEKIEEYLSDVTEEDFMKDSQTQDAVIRRLEIIGEAVKNIPTITREQYSDIQWRQIAGLRDVLIHEYFGVDMEQIWEIVQKDLPGFKHQLVLISQERT